MTDEAQEVSQDRIDIDLDGIDSPYLTVEEGTYQLILADAKLDRTKDKDRPMLRCRWETTHPETGETVSIFDYPLLDQQRGKFRLRQIVIAAGVDPRDYVVGQLVGTAVSAEVEEEESEEYGKQNRIRQILVDVPSAR